MTEPITKYILHGGFKPGKIQQDDLFFQEMLKDTPNKTKLLLVYFAEEDEKISQRVGEDTGQLNLNKGQKEIEIKVATEQTFKEDCAWADVIYLHGGRTVKIMETLSRISNIKDMFVGKIVVADSAGVHALAKFFYSKSSGAVGQGLGILPYKIMAHYEDGMANPFQNIEPELETLLLHENEIKIINN